MRTHKEVVKALKDVRRQKKEAIEAGFKRWAYDLEIIEGVLLWALKSRNSLRG